jgi:hypothetical protein
MEGDKIVIRSPVAGCRFENKWLVKKERDVFLGNGFCKPATGNWQLLRMNGAGAIGRTRRRPRRFPNGNTPANQ